MVGLYIFLKTIGPHNVLDMITALFDINKKVSWKESSVKQWSREREQRWLSFLILKKNKYFFVKVQDIVNFSTYII